MQEEGKIKIAELKEHLQNTVYFDDMKDDVWNDFLQSIRASGVTNAITINQDNVIISGHQRVKACRVLGIEEVSFKRIWYDDPQKEIKDLIESNLKQRVAGNSNPIKLGRCFNFLQEYYGIQNGGDHRSEDFKRRNPPTDPRTKSELATQYGTNDRTMREYQQLANLSPAMQSLVETGKVTKSAALEILSKLSSAEQEQLVSSLDATKKYTQKEIAGYISQLRQKDQAISDMRGEIDSAKQRARDYQTDYQNMKKQFDAKVAELQKARDELAAMNTEEAKYERKLKDSALVFCGKVANFLESIGGYVWLTDKIDELPAQERKGFIDAVRVVKEWAEVTDYNLNEKIKENN